MTTDTTLFPIPQSIRHFPGVLDASRHRWIRIPAGSSPRFKRRAQEFSRAIADGFLVPPCVTAGSPATGKMLVEVRIEPASRTDLQDYRLTLRPEGGELLASSEAGAFYGLETLRQLILQHGAVLPLLEIDDSPAFLQRGVMLDVSRCKVPTMESLYRLVDRLARLKMNQLQLYVEHTFAFSAHSVVWHDASPFTSGEILALDDYCRERFVQLVPNFNSFGHFERWLRHSEYHHLAECPDGYSHPDGETFSYGSTLYPGRESLDLLDELYGEYLPNFTSTLFNIGCDETWELGKGRSRLRCEQEGVTQVYLDHLLQIEQRVKRHGRTMMFWGDIILHKPDLIERLPKDITAMVWGYGAGHPFREQCSHFAKTGVPFYVCPGTSSWNSLIGCWTNTRGNLANAAQNGMEHGAAGFLVTDWGDNGHHQFLPVSYPGFALGAALAWQYDANRNVDAPAMLDRLLFDDDTCGMGSIVCELGNMCELLPISLHNRSPLDRLFFWDMQNPAPDTLLGQITSEQLLRCLERLDEQHARLRGVAPRNAEIALARQELALGASMARHGVSRGLSAISSTPDPATLRHEVQQILPVYETLWLARNRPGGLRESSGRIRKLFEA